MKITNFAHATTLDNESGTSTGSAEVEISPLGEKQILELKEAIKTRTFDAVFASDLSRAIKTAEGALGDRYQVFSDARLREVNIGTYTRRPDSETGPLMGSHIDVSWPEGESLRDVEKRVRNFLEEKFALNPDQHIALVTHQIPQLSLEVITKRISWEQALENDWRKTKAFQNGWDYEFIK